MGMTAKKQDQDNSYAAKVAADVAARYGVTVSPSVVQRVPAGNSAYRVVWSEKACKGRGGLIYVDNNGAPIGQVMAKRSFGGDTRKNRRRNGAAQNPAVISRRALVGQCVAEGLTDDQIAMKLDIDTHMVRADRKHLGLAANPVLMSKSAMLSRLGEARNLILRGFSFTSVDKHMGWRIGSTKLIIDGQEKAAAKAAAKAEKERQRQIVKIPEKAAKALIIATNPKEKRPKHIFKKIIDVKPQKIAKKSIDVLGQITMRRANVLELLRERVPRKDIAKKLGISLTCVTRDIDFLRQCGFSEAPSMRASCGKDAIADREKLILSMAGPDRSARSIAMELNLHCETVRRVLRKAKK